MDKLDSLLLEFFERLGEQGVPLGESDYLTAIEAIESTVGLENPDSFKGLFRCLWPKSREDQKLNSLLLDVFERLRKQGVPLGVSDYLTAIEAIESRVGLENSDSFKGLFRLIWAKSREDQKLFDLAFAELVEPELQTLTKPDNSTILDRAIPPRKGSAKNLRARFISQLQTQKYREHPVDDLPKTEPLLEPQQQWEQLPAKDVKLFVPTTEPTEKPHSYQLTTRLPISRREMVGVWRHLRRPQRVGALEELDVEATIRNLCSSGWLLQPVLRPRRRNQAQLVVLVDQQGSMAPFASLIEATIESILRGGLLGKTNLYYFHDCPEKLLYQRPNLTHALLLETILNEKAKGNSILIIGDAGAARGYYDLQRVKETKLFLQTLSTYTYLYAWLNPMPKSRWVATTAEDIACMIPMFPLDREGLSDAVNILRGHPFPPGVGIDEQNP
ncbi:VWA domain-containing protein [Nostoc sphaeroides CHAB 2801]|uniref:VWA domain-containing protein n=1 Tax=Nostoc sphaeroides TaxID=446679 RepID=UPI000E47E2E3|nr:VWA domain-containing protein [Nostoc sphaeroides]MCC5628131.1 VWA domain-containing protein [Nostoc sphaeroides CHAB 2801]